jgi:DNA-binding MarR family transcriptional regulator
LRLNEISARILLEKSNLTRLVDRLERESYVTRKACDADKRGAYAVITPEGRSLQKRMWPVYAESIKTHFASRLTQQEASSLLGLLRKLDPQLPEDNGVD